MFRTSLNAMPKHALVAAAICLVAFVGLSGCGSSEEPSFFTQQEYDDFNRWCLDIAQETPDKCGETADLIRYSINEAGYSKVDEDCLVWEMQRDVIGFGLYNTWECIEE